MVIPLMILGVLLGGLRGSGVARWWRLRVRKTCAIDRLIAPFHVPFRQIAQE
jgi:hypothetical protein